MTNYKRAVFFVFMWMMLLVLYKSPVQAAGTFQVTGECMDEQKAVLYIDVDEDSKINGFDIFRADTADAEYQYIGNIYVSDNDWSLDSCDTESFYTNGTYDSDNNYHDYFFTDSIALISYQTYYYRVQSYQIINDMKDYVQTMDVSITVPGMAPTITIGKRNGKNSAKLKWEPAADADGYLIYCFKDYDEKGNYIGSYYADDSKYTLVKTIKGAGNASATFKKLTYGVTYTYRICSYKMINGVQMISKYAEVSVPMDYYGTATESYSQRIKRAFGSEKAKNKNFKTAKKAAKQMTTIKIKVWDFQNGKSGKKVTKIKYLTVNKRMAPTIKQMFTEIYNSKEKQVIHDIGCYSYRTGEHMYGLAIDVNANENYMIDGKKVIAGSYWKPKKDPYSIPNNSEFVKIMFRYGFFRGEWGNRKDYMHFSYFGT